MKMSAGQSKLRVKTCSGKVYWLCRNIHEAVGENPCQAKAVEEKEIHIAFINMMNKLKRNVQYTLEPIVLDYEKLEEKKYKDSIEIKQINRELAELSEQNLTMTGLLSQGILDSAIFMPKRDEMQAKIQKLKSRKSIILKNRSSNELLIQTQEILEALNKGSEYITETNKSLFDEIVKEIIGYSEEVIVFKLHNGLEFKERITK